MKPRNESILAGQGTSLVVLLAGSMLVRLSMGRWLAPLAAWIGPAFIMRYARDHKAGRAGCHTVCWMAPL